MKLLLLFVILPTVLGQAGFGTSYLKNSRLCHKWNCINTNLGLPDSLPSKQQSEETLRRVLPVGLWQDVVGKVLDHCYGNRTRRFTNTCPGQALLHCFVDQMIDNCPEGSWRKDDACSPVSSLAGLKYMFAQSRYDNLEKNLPIERRPSWFLKNYFDSKCCDLPVMFNTTIIEECGFSSFINYHIHGVRYTDAQIVNLKNHGSTPATTSLNNGDTLKIVDFTQMADNNDITDPLDCCDMTQFIQPSWRSECDFHLSWGVHDRLVISKQSRVSTEAPVTTTTEKVNQIKDLMLLPHSNLKYASSLRVGDSRPSYPGFLTMFSFTIKVNAVLDTNQCEKEECVFRKLGIINASGLLDIDAYMKMLHNFTNAHPAWTKSNARVFTKCLVKPVSRNYDAGCEINNILSCTFDVLTENCPYTKKSNICKHGYHQVGCQISSSKYRPKNRREICLMPELIHHDYLSECGLESIYRAEHVVVPTKSRKLGWVASNYMCKDSVAPTTCIMNKMGVLNKYNFMDYFRMKDRIRQFSTDQVEWAALLEIYMSAFMNIPMYAEHCNSQKKLLNVIDAMLMTCPVSKRKNTAQCNKIFTEMTNTAPVDNQNATREKLDEILKHYHHVFMPYQPLTSIHDQVIRKKHSKVIKKPEFEFGLLNSKDAPPVKVINVKSEPTSNRPLILRPVYLRPNYGQRPYNNDVNKRIHKIFKPLTIPPIYTMPTTSTKLYPTRPLTTATDFPIEMLKPE